MITHPKSCLGAAGTGGGPPAKITLAEMERRLEKARPKRVSLQATDASNKKTYRLDLPGSYQPAFQGLSGEARFVRGSEDQLVLVPLEVWPEYLRTIRNSFGQFPSEFLLKDPIRNSWHVEIASKGRVQIPPDSAEIAGLENEAQLYAVEGAIEIWNPQKYRQCRNKAYAELHETQLRPAGAKDKVSQDFPEEAANG